MTNGITNTYIQIIINTNNQLLRVTRIHSIMVILLRGNLNILIKINKPMMVKTMIVVYLVMMLTIETTILMEVIINRVLRGHPHPLSNKVMEVQKAIRLKWKYNKTRFRANCKYNSLNTKISKINFKINNIKIKTNVCTKVKTVKFSLSNRFNSLNLPPLLFSSRYRHKPIRNLRNSKLNHYHNPRNCKYKNMEITKVLVRLFKCNLEIRKKITRWLIFRSTTLA